MFTLTDILRAEGVEPRRVLLLRHSNKPCLWECQRIGMLREYTCIQPPTESKNVADLWLIFTPHGRGNGSRLAAVYENHGIIPAPDRPIGLPEEAGPHDGDVWYDLRDSELLSEYVDRLAVDWTCNAINWERPASRQDFPVIELSDPTPMPFPGFGELRLDRPTLCEIINDPLTYAAWRDAMSSVQAVYLITCLHPGCGKQYVGSATGKDNLWQRWRDYADDGFGGNTGLKKHLEHLDEFQYSVLDVYRPTIDAEVVRSQERRYKYMLDSVNNGLNDNY